MTRNDWDDDWDEDWEDEPEEPIEAGTIECPHCGAEIYEEAPQCPRCGEYVVHGTGEFWKNKPIWYVLLALLGIVAVIVALAGMP